MKEEFRVPSENGQIGTAQLWLIDGDANPCTDFDDPASVDLLGEINFGDNESTIDTFTGVLIQMMSKSTG